MALKKCPRCELNYILDGGELCSVCREEVSGRHTPDEISALCSVCGEAPVLPGEDVCRNCLMEMRQLEMLARSQTDDMPAPQTGLEPEVVSELMEIEGLEADALPDDEENEGETAEPEL